MELGVCALLMLTVRMRSHHHTSNKIARPRYLCKLCKVKGKHYSSRVLVPLCEDSLALNLGIPSPEPSAASTSDSSCWVCKQSAIIISEHEWCEVSIQIVLTLKTTPTLKQGVRCPEALRSGCSTLGTPEAVTNCESSAGLHY